MKKSLLKDIISLTLVSSLLLSSYVPVSAVEFIDSSDNIFVSEQNEQHTPPI